MSDDNSIPSKKDLERDLSDKIELLREKRKKSNPKNETPNTSSKEFWEAKLLDTIEGKKLTFSGEMNKADNDVIKTLTKLREVRETNIEPTGD